jgi:Protein of unknown function (DUF1360)
MDHVDETPTEPLDYAALNAAYGALLATVALAAATRKRDDELLRPSELLPMGAATFALSKLIVNEKVVTWVRRPFVHESTPGRPPRGKGLRYATGELLTCTRCVGAWAALGIVGLRLVHPAAGRTVSAVLAASAANDFLQAGFSWVRDGANRAASP